MRTDRGWRRFYATGWFVSAVIAGIGFLQWKAHIQEVESRAEEAERTREEAARRRAVEERLHIARELHDSLTHTISVIKVQSGVAVHLARKRGEELPPALLAIQEASTDAARELRSTLEVLRSDEDPDSSGLERLPGLLNRARTSGLAITVATDGTARELPADVNQAAYRVVQEAITNVSRHAGGATATVTLSYRPDTFIIRVDDDGPTLDKAPAPGHGLIGMKERVTALGGDLRAEPRRERGFSVLAELPLDGTGS